MNGKLNKNIGFSLMPFAFIFLFEPGFSILDPLPDLIGYLMLCLAVINLADICPTINDALTGFKKGILISLARFIAIYLLKSVFTDYQMNLGVLIIAFTISFFELVVLIPAFKKLFEGLLSLGIMHNGNAIYYKKCRKIKKTARESGKVIILQKETRSNVTESAYGATVAFLLIRALAMTLPEFTTLISDSAYEFAMLLRIFGVAIALPVGIFWLVKMISYCNSVRKDTAFIESLSEKYRTTAEGRPGYYTARMISAGLGALTVAYVLSVDFFSDYVNLLPEYLFFAAIAVSAILLKQYFSKWKLLLATGALGIAVSALNHHFTVAFHGEYYPAAIKKNLGAYYSYYKMLGATAAEAVVFILTAILIMLMLYEIYAAHSVLPASGAGRSNDDQKKRFFKHAIPVICLAVLSAAGSVYYVYAQPFYHTGGWIFYYSAVIYTAINLAFILTVCSFIGYIKGSVKSRYKLDLM